MSDQYSPSDLASQAAESFGEDSLELLGNVIDTDNLEAQRYLASLDFSQFREPEPQVAEAEKIQEAPESSQSSRSPIALPRKAISDTEQGPTPNALSNVEDEAPYDQAQIWEDHDELSNFQYGGPQEFPIDFNSEEWKDVENYIANGDFADISNPIDQELYPQGNIDDSFNPAQLPVNSQQWSPFTTPVIDAGYDTAGISRGASDGPVPAKHNELVNAVEHSSASNTQGASYSIYSATHSFAEEGSAAMGDAEADESEDEEEEEEEDLPDQVKFETYIENDPLIVQSPRQRGWGRTGTRNGQEVWFNPRNLRWQPSASHHDMRETLIARAQAEFPHDQYIHPDPTDGLPHGETAFFKPHQYRTPNRNDCADELFEWRDYTPKRDANGKALKREKPKTTIKKPGYMYEGDKILLDPHNNPVVNHKYIPLTLSALTDGAKLQEMALQPGCKHGDLWARMPRWEQVKEKNGKMAVVGLRNKNTRINMPMTRFRERKGTIAGGDRQGSEAIRAGLLNFYLHHDFDPAANGNSVKGFYRDLEPWEVKQVRLGNKAKFGNRAGKRALGEDKRKTEYEKTIKSIENGRKREAATRGGDAPRHHFQDQEDGVDDSNHASRKRVHMEPGYVPTRSGGTSSRGRGKKAASSKVQRYGTLGGVQSAYQNPNPVDMYQEPKVPRYNDYLAAGLELPEETTQSAGHGWAAQNPYGFGGNSGMQHGSSQWSREAASNATPYVPQNELRGSNAYGPVYANYDNGRNNAYLMDENRQRAAFQGRNDQFPSSGYTDQSPYGPPERSENTLGADGRKAYQAPKKAIGKRREQDAGEHEHDEHQRKRKATGAPRPVLVAPDQNVGAGGQVLPSLPNGSPQEQANAPIDPEAGPKSHNQPQKSNGAPGPEPKPQHRRQTGKAPQPKRYGAEGAPKPLLPPPTANSAGGEDGPLVPPDEMFGHTPFTADFYGDAEGPFLAPETFSMFDSLWDPAQRGAHLPPSQSYLEDTPEIKAAELAAQESSTDGEDLYTEEAPQVGDGQSPDGEQAPADSGDEGSAEGGYQSYTWYDEEEEEEL